MGPEQYSPNRFGSENTFITHNMRKADPKIARRSNLQSLMLENDSLKISVLPEIGGKMTELTSKETGTQFLYTQDIENLVIPQFRDKFDERFAFGFDECFPTIAPCSLSYQEGKIELADHGEVWSQPWKYKYDHNSIQLEVEGICLDYSLHKTISLSGNSINIEYRLSNTGSYAFDYIWSAHPLLNVDAGDQLLLDDEIREVMVNWSSDSTIGSYGDWLPWPALSINESKDWSLVREKKLGKAVKLFSDKLKNGKAGIYRQRSDQSVVFTFNPVKNPYLGIWLCYGGWPEGNDVKKFNLALEPSSSRPDALDKAILRKESAKIEKGETLYWSLKIHCIKGKAKI